MKAQIGEYQTFFWGGGVGMCQFVALYLLHIV